MKEFKSRDKLTQRMTRDGAVLDNQSTGEEIHISERDAEKQLSPDGQPVQMGKRDAPMNPAEDVPKHGRQLRPQEQKEPEKEQPKPQQPSAEPFQPQGGSPVSHIPQDIPTSAAPGGTVEKLIDRAAAEHNAHKARQVAQMSRDAAQQRYSASHLQFSEEERAAPELQKAIRKSDKAADKLDAARAAIPKKRVLGTERVFDEASGAGRTRLVFHETDKPASIRQPGPNPLARPLQEVAHAAHAKVREVEQENSGVAAGHLTERGMEKAVGYGNRKLQNWRAERQVKPWRDAAKAEQAAVRANAEALYQKALHDNPQLASGSPISRIWQKKRMQRQYAAAYRASRGAEGAKAAAQTAARSAKKGAEAAKKAGEFIARHKKVFLIIGGIGLVLVLLLGLLQSCSSMFGGGVSNIVASSYLSEDADLLAAEAAYCAKEDELRRYLDTYEQTHDYDEYHYDLDEIEHDPYVLLSILSALHEGQFTIDQVQGDLQMLFDRQYILTETVEVERRYYIETDTWTDEEGNTHTESYRVYYDYYICTVKLENFDLSHLPVYMMDQETLSMYAVYMSTLGNRPDLFPSSGYVPKYVTNPPAKYEIPAEYLSDERFATLITEAEKYLGFPYVWGGSSPSTSFDCSGFVSYVLTNSGLCDTGRLGAQGLYNISTPVSEPRPGDLVFFVGTYDTPGVSHVGFYVGDGMLLHCGDPIQYTSLNTNYWQSHLYAYGRPPYN